MPILLGDRSSVSPVPTGRPSQHAVGGAGGIAFPAQGNWLVVSGDGASPTFNLPYRYYLCVGYNSIFSVTTAWTRLDFALRLVVNGTYGVDYNGHGFHQNADSFEVSGGWCGGGIETKFHCDANINYQVYILSWNTPSGASYYQHPHHTNFWYYTVGEGVY